MRKPQANLAMDRDKSLPPTANAPHEVAKLLDAIDRMATHRHASDAAGATITVNESAIRANIGMAKEQIRNAGSGATLSAVIKADAYGLGAPRFARLLREEGVKDLFVARTSEAVELRQSMRAENPATGDDTAVFLLDGPPAQADMNYLIEHKITPVLNSLAQVAQWNEAGIRHNVKLPAILQFDTGMSRAGMSDQERAELKPRQRPDETSEDFAARQESGTARLSNINVLYVMSHLGTAGGATANADGTHTPNADTVQQRSNFERVRQDFPGTKATLAASSGIFLGRDYHYDMVRGGGVFHGQAPFGADENPLRPAVTLTTTIEQLRELRAGDKVGYGGNFVADKPTLVAVANIGYADGLPRIKGSNAAGAPPLTAKATFVDETGTRHDAPAIAATSMDMNTYDVTKFPLEGRERGAKLNLIDDHTTLDHFGAQFGTNAAEFETKMASRIHRNVRVDDADKVSTRGGVPRPIPAGASPNAWAVIPQPARD
ncbi:MAG: alanine racemase [Janthinobacterium lividum]